MLIDKMTGLKQLLDTYPLAKEEQSGLVHEFFKNYHTNQENPAFTVKSIEQMQSISKQLSTLHTFMDTCLSVLNAEQLPEISKRAAINSLIGTHTALEFENTRVYMGVLKKALEHEIQKAAQIMYFFEECLLMVDGLTVHDLYEIYKAQ